jgi:hypothetical protein
MGTSVPSCWHSSEGVSARTMEGIGEASGLRLVLLQEGYRAMRNENLFGAKQAKFDGFYTQHHDFGAAS